MTAHSLPIPIHPPICSQGWSTLSCLPGFFTLWAPCPAHTTSQWTLTSCYYSMVTEEFQYCLSYQKIVTMGIIILSHSCCMDLGPHLPKEGQEIYTCVSKPKDLNKAIIHVHLKAPMLEEVTNRLLGCNVFSTLGTLSSSWPLVFSVHCFQYPRGSVSFCEDAI